MKVVGEREIRTQRRVVAFLREALGYGYLGHWQDRAGNRNVEEDLVRDWLERQGHDDRIITRALRECAWPSRSASMRMRCAWLSLHAWDGFDGGKPNSRNRIVSLEGSS